MLLLLAESILYYTGKRQKKILNVTKLPICFFILAKQQSANKSLLEKHACSFVLKTSNAHF